MTRVPLGLLLGLAVACGSAPPATHYYQLAIPAAERRAPPAPGIALAIEPLAVDAAYSTDRIVYRRSPYRLDYYHYHRWSAPPALHLADVLRDAYQRTGAFERVTLEAPDSPALELRGRVLALEEVDESESRWLGRIALELSAVDARTGELLWSESFTEVEPLAEQTPEGLARSLSVAVQRIVQRSTPAIAKAGAELLGAALSSGSATTARAADCLHPR